MSHKPQIRPRRGRALAAILAVAAGSWLIAVAAEDSPGETKNPLGSPAAPLGANQTGTAVTPAPSGNVTAVTGNQTSGNATANANAQISTGDLQALERFILQPQSHLSELRKAIEHLEKMTPEEYKALQDHVILRNQSIRQVMAAIRTDLNQLSPPDRNVIQRYITTLYPEGAQALLIRFQAATTPEDRKKILDEMLAKAAAMGIKPQPPPERGQQGANRGGPGDRGQSRGRRNGPPPMPVPPPAESVFPDKK